MSVMDINFSFFIGFLIFWLAIGVIVAIVFKVFKLRSLELISWRKNVLIAAGYLLLLILAIPVLYSLPQDDVSKNGQGIAYERDSRGDRMNGEAYQGTSPILNRLLERTFFDTSITLNDLENEPGIYKKSSQTFQLEPGTTQVKWIDRASSRKVCIERKEVDDGQIEVHTYYSRVSLNGTDITALLSPSDVSYSHGVITIEPQEEQSLRFAAFKRDFTVRQFADPNLKDHFGFPFEMGWEIVLIQVPSSLEIEPASESY